MIAILCFPYLCRDEKSPRACDQLKPLAAAAKTPPNLMPSAALIVHFQKCSPLISATYRHLTYRSRPPIALIAMACYVHGR